MLAWSWERHVAWQLEWRRRLVHEGMLWYSCWCGVGLMWLPSSDFTLRRLLRDFLALVLDRGLLPFDQVLTLAKKLILRRYFAAKGREFELPRALALVSHFVGARMKRDQYVWEVKISSARRADEVKI
jgi:hypothetical protein